MVPFLVDNFHQSPIDIAPHLEQKRTSDRSDYEPDSDLHFFYSFWHRRRENFPFFDEIPRKKIAPGKLRGRWGQADQCVITVISKKIHHGYHHKLSHVFIK